MKYLKLFDTENDYKSYRDSEGGVYSAQCIPKYRHQ